MFGGRGMVAVCLYDRSSHWRDSVKKGLLKNVANFTGKHLSWSLFNKVANFKVFFKKRLQHKCFPVNFANFFWTTILRNICERLLISCHSKISILSWEIYYQRVLVLRTLANFVMQHEPKFTSLFLTRKLYLFVKVVSKPQQ